MKEDYTDFRGNKVYKGTTTSIHGVTKTASARAIDAHSGKIFGYTPYEERSGGGRKGNSYLGMPRR